MSAATTSRAMDILAAIFFIIAGAWLLIALLYSCLVLAFLRLRARGELGSIYDEGFGRVYLFGGNRFYIPLGFVFRRYVQHLQFEQGRVESMNVRFMTRQERRAALENVLSKQSPQSADDQEDAGPVDAEVGMPAHDTASAQGPVCSICLNDYEESDSVLGSANCQHQFHHDCILKWLERQSNTECPCCRVTMVKEDEIWAAVQRNRKEMKKRIRREKKQRANENKNEMDVTQSDDTENSGSADVA